LTKEKPKEILDIYKGTSLPDRHDVRESDVNMNRLGAVLNMAYERGIDNFDDLLLLKGLGPKTLRSVALVSEVVHGDSSRFDDPARFSFAVGGKDGVPHPVDTETYDETIEVLQDSVEKSRLGYNDKSTALKRLHRATRKSEKGYTPSAFLSDVLKMEWKHAEKKGGMTFMGETIKGVTRAIVSIQNHILYGNNGPKD
jgi:hypothetical protein